MITKEPFIRIVSALEEEIKMLSALEDALGGIHTASKLYNLLYIVVYALVEDTEKINDNDKCEEWENRFPIIYDYLYDYDCGKNYKDKYLIEIDNIKYKPENADELYEVLLLLRANKEKNTYK